MKTYTPVPLHLFRKDQKFIWNNKIYTVFQIEGNMAEVACDGKFWAWPTRNHFGSIRVTPITLD